MRNQKKAIETKIRIEQKLNKYFGDINNLSSKKPISPDEKELKSLQKLYARKKLDEVEKSSILLLRKRLPHPYPLKILASILKEKKRLAESINLLKEVVILDPKDASSHYNIANALKSLSKYEESETHYRHAIRLKPSFVEARYNLGSLFNQCGLFDQAKINFEKAILLKPNYFEARVGLAAVLRSLGDLEGSEKNYNYLSSIYPTNQYFILELGKVLRQQSKTRDALKCFTRVLELNSQQIEARVERLRCLYYLDLRDQVSDELDYLLSQNIVDTVVGSITHRFWAKYGVEKINLYCREPMRYVSLTDLSKSCDFDHIFKMGLKHILNSELVSYRSQSLLDNGNQSSGNIFEIDNPYIKEMRKVILAEIERYRLKHSGSEEGLFRNWPVKYSLKGWLITMDNKGAIKPHIHGYGWLSGSIYINVPVKSNTDAGNFVVTLGDGDETSAVSRHISKVVDVTTGSLVIFPASLMHYSIPFKSDEKRILLAFDFIPEA